MAREKSCGLKREDTVVVVVVVAGDGARAKVTLLPLFLSVVGAPAFVVDSEAMVAAGDECEGSGVTARKESDAGGSSDRAAVRCALDVDGVGCAAICGLLRQGTTTKINIASTPAAHSLFKSGLANCSAGGTVTLTVYEPF